MFNKPFLKWVGGKHRALSTITQYINNGHRLYIPFAGSLAIFINTDFKEYVISDTNPDLIATYQTLVKHSEEFILYVASLFTDGNNTPNAYYAHREEFNRTQDVFRKSALFIYLNRHCFNGLCRYNSRGEFNSPFGLYPKPYFPAKEMRYFCERVMQCQSVTFTVCDYTTALETVVAGDTVYCDPPALARSETAHFANYHAVRFNIRDHEQLASMAYEMASNGISVLITNHDVAGAREIYRYAQLDTYTLYTLVSARPESRIEVKELIAFFDSSLDKYYRHT